MIMKYSVINGEFSVKDVKIKDLSSSSTVFAGDVKTICLSSILETPPESLIVGVTIGPPPVPPVTPPLPIR
ncbi:spore gernimation protein [Brevibacillus sp. B_LB10_24]|uniref:spore gernimation protein n=1 Tax=Brevibacillus sp. B_LB10_24 TaxID=3380645 RepID=UPI0038B8FCF7